MPFIEYLDFDEPGADWTVSVKFADAGHVRHQKVRIEHMLDLVGKLTSGEGGAMAFDEHSRKVTKVQFDLLNKTIQLTAI
jgi:hypothetical protein